MEITLSTRDERLDLIRVLAGFCVVLIHVAGHGMSALPPLSSAWNLRNAINCFLRPAAPVFFILSGILFLHPSKNLQTKHFFKDHILRLIRLWLIWSAFYALSDMVHLITGPSQTFPTLSQIGICFLHSFLAGHYHLWFLPALLVAYLCAPFLQMLFSSICTSTDKKLPSAGFVVLCLFISVTLLVKTIEPFSSLAFLRSLSLLSAVPLLPVGLLYFITGYLLTRQKRFPAWHSLLLYISSSLAMILINSYYVRISGQNAAVTYGYETIWVFLSSVSCFLFLMELFTNYPSPSWLKPVIRDLSGNTVGIYLIHAWLIEELGSPRFAFLFEKMQNLPGLLLIGCIIYLLSILLIKMLHALPILGTMLLG